MPRQLIKQIKTLFTNDDADSDYIISETEKLGSTQHSKIFYTAFGKGYQNLKPKLSQNLNPFQRRALYDERSGKYIRQSAMLEAHFACKGEFEKLPRRVNKQDCDVRIGSDYKTMLERQHENVFNLPLLAPDKQTELRKQDRLALTKRQLKDAFRRTFIENGKINKTKRDLRRELFENENAFKIPQCRYRDWARIVTLYFNPDNFVFAIVDPISNKLLEFSVATNIDYVDIFRYRAIFTNQTSLELLHLPQGLEQQINVTSVDDKVCRIDDSFFDNFDSIVQENLQSLDFEQGWWISNLNYLKTTVDPLRLDKLSTEEKRGPKNKKGESTVKYRRNVESESEALFMLQAENLGIVSNPKRLKVLQDGIDLDFIISDWDREKFPGLEYSDTIKRVYADMKEFMDPQVIIARGYEHQSLEFQAENSLEKIFKQRERATDNDSFVIHIISLFYIKPAQRLYMLNYFKRKAAERNIDLFGIVFTNTEMDD